MPPRAIVHLLPEVLVASFE